MIPMPTTDCEGVNPVSAPGVGSNVPFFSGMFFFTSSKFQKSLISRKYICSNVHKAPATIISTAKNFGW